MNDRKLLLGEYLLKKNLITARQLKEALEHTRSTGFRLGHSLVRLEILTDTQLADILTRHLEQPCRVVRSSAVPRPVLDLLSFDFCFKNRCIPVEESGDKLIVAVTDPYDINLMDDLRYLLQRDVELILATEHSIIQLIYKVFDKKSRARDKELKTEQDDSQIISLVNQLICDAVDRQASDIHLETYESSVQLRFRIDGILYNQNPPSFKDIHSIISRIKIMANLNIAEKRLPQDGRIVVRDNAYDVDIRVSIIPGIYGENIVLRILDKKRSSYSLDQLGLSEKEEKMIRDLLRKKQGLILSAGPTGSGKTTTLYAMLKILNIPERKILTIEDPVEYKIDNVLQSEVNPKIDLTFAMALRSFLRHDPDIIMVGEIRDQETARIAVRAALTGHLVLSTIHTNDAPSAVTRLLDMGIEPYLLSSTLEMVISQRLVRKFCIHCLEKKKQKNKTVYHVKGCGKCSRTGYLGRTGLFEILSVDEKVRKAIQQKMTAQEIKKIAEQGGYRDLLHDSREKISRGLTSEEEVRKVI